MVKIFISYSHKDENLKKELENHLAGLRRQGVISVWHDRCIGLGDNIDDEIDAHLEAADIVLLLGPVNTIREHDFLMFRCL